ncbi:hypothetical protein ACWDMY_24320, partial [Streptomyces globisporus]
VVARGPVEQVARFDLGDERGGQVGLVEESDGKALDDQGRRDEGRRRQADADRLGRRDRPDGTSGR